MPSRARALHAHTRALHSYGSMLLQQLSEEVQQLPEESVPGINHNARALRAVLMQARVACLPSREALQVRGCFFKWRVLSNVCLPFA